MLTKRNVVPETMRTTSRELRIQRAGMDAPELISNCRVLTLLDHSSRELNYQLRTTLQGSQQPVLKLDEGDLRLTPVDFAYLLSQRLANVLAGVSRAAVARLVIVYSPSWAGECRLPADAQRIRIAHRQIRDSLRIIYDQETAGQVQIIYGGFVFEEELADVLCDSNEDGVLINK